MTQWFQSLPEDKQHLIQRGWGSREFASWTSSFLLSMGTTMLKRKMPEDERRRFDLVLRQRSLNQHQPGHRPDFIERLYNALHQEVASIVQEIDDHTGKHGETSVRWLDTQLAQLQQTLHGLYDDFTGNR